MFPYRPRHLQHLPKIRTPILIGRSSNRNEYNLNIIQHLCQRNPKSETPRLHIPTQHRLQPRLVNRNLSPLQPSYLLAIRINAMYIRPNLSETYPAHKPHVARTYYRYLHALCYLAPPKRLTKVKIIFPPREPLLPKLASCIKRRLRRMELSTTAQNNRWTKSTHKRSSWQPRQIL